MRGRRELKFGHFVVEFATPGIGHILKGAGCDFVLFDTEHSGFGFETIKSAVRYFEAARLPAIFRVPSKAYDQRRPRRRHGRRGASWCRWSTRATRRAELVSYLKYTPAGRRGVALGIAHDNYGNAARCTSGSPAPTGAPASFAQIETASGVEQAEAIAAVEGVDCLWIGHFDLSASLGIPGQFEHPDFLEAIDRVAAACRKHGKALGRLVPDAASGHRLRDARLRFPVLVGRRVGAAGGGARRHRRDPRGPASRRAGRSRRGPERWRASASR